MIIYGLKWHYILPRNVSPKISMLFDTGLRNIQNFSKSVDISLQFWNFLTFFRQEIKIAEMFSMVPNSLWESNWVCGTIPFDFKLPIYRFTSFTDLPVYNGQFN